MFKLFVISVIMMFSVSSLSAQQGKLVSNHTHNAEFGGSVACSNWGEYMVVGCPSDSVNGVVAGAVHIYLNTDSAGWVFVQEINRGVNAAASDMFGAAVDISDDGMRLVVGAPGDDDAGSGAGAVFVYNRSAPNDFDFVCQLLSDQPENGARFGSSLAIDEDGTYLIIGEPGQNYQQGMNSFPDGGAAYTYVYSGPCYNYESTLQADTLSANAQFGFSVAIGGEGEFALIGAIRDRVNGTFDRGAVYHYEHDFSPDWDLIRKITTNHPDAWNFGWDVGISKNAQRAIIGAPGNLAFAAEGFAFLLNPSGIGLDIDTFVTDLVGYGWSVSIDHSGSNMLVGFPSENEATLISYEANAFTEQSRFSGFDVNINLNEDFGACVDISSEGQFSIVGAPNHRINGSPVGAAYADNLNGRCVEFREILLGTISSSLYRADQYIRAIVPVDSFNMVFFVAGDSVIFGPGFHVPLMTDIQVVMQNCNTGVN